MGEIAGGGNYDELLSHVIQVSAYGLECLCLDLDSLIRAKRAAGCPEDLLVIAELEALRQERLDHGMD